MGHVVIVIAGDGPADASPAVLGVLRRLGFELAELPQDGAPEGADPVAWAGARVVDEAGDAIRAGAQLADGATAAEVGGLVEALVDVGAAVADAVDAARVPKKKTGKAARRAARRGAA